MRTVQSGRNLSDSTDRDGYHVVQLELITDREPQSTSGYWAERHTGCVAPLYLCTGQFRLHLRFCWDDRPDAHSVTLTCENDDVCKAPSVFVSAWG